MSEVHATSPQPDFHSAQARAERFGFECSRCSHCCHDKRIQVNPYEVARLARNQGLGSAEFRRTHTEDGAGTFLNRRESGACVFLGPAGCTVHADRPLVCRVYPLGRHIDDHGQEYFTHLTPHPQSGGAFHADGTIASYLEAQGALEFMRAADAYFWWFVRARAVLLANPGRSADLQRSVATMLDLDAAVALHQQESGATVPVDLEARRALHMEVLNRQLERLAASDPAG